MTKRKEIPKWRVCTMCAEKWAQANSAVCRRCDQIRQSVVDTVYPKQVVMPKRTPAFLSRHYEPPDPLEQRPEHEVRGVLYVVVWSGVDAGGEALGIPPAGLRGSPAFNAARLERFA